MFVLWLKKMFYSILKGMWCAAYYVLRRMTFPSVSCLQSVDLRLGATWHVTWEPKCCSGLPNACSHDFEACCRRSFSHLYLFFFLGEQVDKCDWAAWPVCVRVVWAVWVLALLPCQTAAVLQQLGSAQRHTHLQLEAPWWGNSDFHSLQTISLGDGSCILFYFFLVFKVWWS